MNRITDHIDFDKYNEQSDDHANVRAASSFRDELYDSFHGERRDEGVWLPWKRMGWFKLRPHEVTIWSGINGHGKSVLLGQAMLEAMTQGARVCIASFEMPAATTLSRMCRQATGAVRPDRDIIERFNDWTDDRLWIYDQTGTVSWKRVLGVIKYAIKELGVDQFVIDSLMKCGINPEDMAGEKAFVDELTTLAKDSPIHIHLVDHIRKQENEYKMPGKFDVRGNGQKTDMVDNVLIVYRNKRKEHEAMRDRDAQKDEIMDLPDAYLICDKQRNGTGYEGQTHLWFHRESMQYQGSDSPDPKHSIDLSEEPHDERDDDEARDD